MTEESKNIIYGKYVGDICNRNWCDGIIQAHERDDCSCHIFSPCFFCENVEVFCDKCGYDSEEDKH